MMIKDETHASRTGQGSYAATLPATDAEGPRTLCSNGGTEHEPGRGPDSLARIRARLRTAGVRLELGLEWQVCGGRVRLEGVTPDERAGTIWMTFRQLDAGRETMTISAGTWIDLVMAGGVCDA